MSGKDIIFGHALKNSLIPVITYFGPMLAYIVTGSLVVEQIFAVPGIGRAFVNSITGRDYPLIMGTTIVLAVLIVVMNLVSDILYLGIRAGASISILGLDVKYKDDLVNRNDNFEETYYMFPGIQSGLSLIYRPLIFLEIELGCDLEHIFMQGSYSGVIKGFMNLGLRI